MVTKKIKNMGISMWKALGLWLCVQKAKELWFEGYLTSIQTATKAWLSHWEQWFSLIGALRGGGWMERRGQTGSQTSFVPPLYFSLSLFLLKSSISSLLPPPSCKCMTWGINWMGRRREGSTERSNTSLSCLLTFIYSVLRNIVVICLPRFLCF